MSDDKQDCCCSSSGCCGESMSFQDKVARELESIRPALQRDGGDVELVEAKDGVVTVRLTGACGGCPMAQMTLKNGIEARLKEAIPEVEKVEPA